MINKSQRRNGLIILASIVVILLTAVVVVAIQSKSSVKAPSTDGSEIVVKGTAVCLPHKNTDGPQTMECALGIKDEKGQHYALSDTDPSYKNVSNMPTGEMVEVKGTLEKGNGDKYDTVGTLKVTSVTRK
jgi:hypothetical protein